MDPKKLKAWADPKNEDAKKVVGSSSTGETAPANNDKYRSFARSIYPGNADLLFRLLGCRTNGAQLALLEANPRKGWTKDTPSFIAKDLARFGGPR